MTFVLEWDNAEQADKIKRHAAEKVKAKETLYKAKYGPKKYKDFMKKDDAEKSPPIKNPKGVRALHKGKWGYMKNKKFKAD